MIAWENPLVPVTLTIANGPPYLRNVASHHQSYLLLREHLLGCSQG